MSSVSVIIPSLYEIDHEYLKLCVESLQATTNWNIIVVTNGSKVKPVLPFICTHIHTSQQGQCNAVNIGVQVAQSEYIMVSNSDMYYAPGWNKYISHSEDWSNLEKMHYLVFSPNLIEPVNNAGSAEPFLKLDAGLTIEEFKPEVVEGFVKEKVKEGKDKPYYGSDFREPGFNLPFFIKRDFFNFLGGYDVGFDPWGSNSDTDLQTRINEAGVTPMRLRDVLVYHFSNKTPTFSPENDAFRQHNFIYFKEKHGFDRDELGSDVWYNTDMLPADKEKIKYEQPPYIS